MKKLVWLLGAAALAAAVVIFLNVMRDRDGIAVYEPVASRAPVGGPAPSGPREPDFYSVIWEKVPPPPTAPKPVVPPGMSSIPGLSFILRSVFLVKSGGLIQGFAAIEIKGEEYLYSEGAELPGGYRLVMVDAFSATLEKDGRSYVLRLNEAGPVEPVPELSAAASEEAAPSEEPDFDPGKPVKFEDESGMQGDRIDVPSEVWSYAVNNLHRLLHDIRVKTDLDKIDGEMKGLWIDPYADSLPYKLGFRIGDSIRSIDGSPITSMGDVMNLYQKFLEEPPERVRITFERNGILRVREIEIK